MILIIVWCGRPVRADSNVGQKREELRDLYGGIAVEMEAAGMMTRLPVAVIRGISDFADSHKSKEWQPYAAITAAAYAKEVLLSLPHEPRQEWRSMSMIESGDECCSWAVEYLKH